MRNSHFQFGLHSKIPDKVDLEYFKKTNTNILKRQGSNLEIGLQTNGILFSIGLHSLHNNINQKDIQRVIKQISQLKIEVNNIDDEYELYNNQQTIKAILCQGINRITNKNTWSEWVQLINRYPVLIFCIVAYTRAKGIQQLNTNEREYELDLIGNELQLLKKYNTEIRNMPLEIVAHALNIRIRINWQNETEDIGSIGRCMDLFVKKYSILLEVDWSSQQPQLNQIKNIAIRRSIQMKQAKQSRSINKSSNDAERMSVKNCIKCGKVKTTRFCQCRKQTPTRNSITPITSISQKPFLLSKFVLTRQKQN